MEVLRLDGASLDLPRIVQVARQNRSVSLDSTARSRMSDSFEWVRRASQGEVRGEDGAPLPVYGVNTGYGSLSRVRIPVEKAQELSWNLIRSHAAGVGPAVSIDVTRAMMLLRANALAKGASGCRPELVETLIAMLNRGVIPEVPTRGSCGSSGDLAPLSHLAIVLFRGPEGDTTPSGFAYWQGERLSGAEAMARAGIKRLQPGPKEGLAVTNGAQLTTAFAALACSDAQQLILTAEIAAAMSWEALLGVTRALDPAVHALRPYRGAIECAANLLAVMRGSTYTNSLPDKVQDAYSLRCTPQVVGAVRDGVRFAADQIGIELNAATDNPLILVDADSPNKAFSAGLFHGEPVGMAADHLRLAVGELAAIAERRIYRLTTGTLSGRLPPLLARWDRPEMGLMMPHTTAAALVSENRSLAWPASADSIPTCEDQEDHVAMSTTAARRAARVVRNAQHVIAIEILAAARGLWWRQAHSPDRHPGAGTMAALAAAEAVLGHRDWGAPSEPIAKLLQAVVDGTLIRAVESEIGPLPGRFRG